MPKPFFFGSHAWLIAYDIADPRRLAKVHRLLMSVAMPVQYSVFLGWMNDSQVANLEARLRALVDEDCDDVRLYHLPRKAWMALLGKPWLPEGVYLLQGGPPLQMELPIQRPTASE